MKMFPIPIRPFHSHLKGNLGTAGVPSGYGPGHLQDLLGLKLDLGPTSFQVWDYMILFYPNGKTHVPRSSYLDDDEYGTHPIVGILTMYIQIHMNGHVTIPLYGKTI